MVEGGWEWKERREGEGVKERKRGGGDCFFEPGGLKSGWGGGSKTQSVYKDPFNIYILYMYNKI